MDGRTAVLGPDSDPAGTAAAFLNIVECRTLNLVKSPTDPRDVARC